MFVDIKGFELSFYNAHQEACNKKYICFLGMMYLLSIGFVRLVVVTIDRLPEMR